MHPHEYELMTKPETARFLRICARQLEKLHELGDGPPRVQLSARRVAYRRSDVLVWVEHRTIPARAPVRPAGA